jgi:hypothetical protein
MPPTYDPVVARRVFEYPDRLPTPQEAWWASVELDQREEDGDLDAETAGYLRRVLADAVAAGLRGERIDG